MTTATLSAKTQKVFDLIQQDTPLNEIAEQMGVTPQAIYAHRNKLIEAGLIPDNRRGKAGRTPALDRAEGKQLAAGNGNGKPKPETSVSPFLRAKLDEVNQELERLDAEAQEIQARLDAIVSERDQIETLRDALATA